MKLTGPRERSPKSLVVDLGKKNVLGVLVDAVDYEAAVDRVITAARDRRRYSASALAVHGVMSAVHDPALRYRINRLDLAVPDGQPVRWAINLLHGARLRRQVRGTNFMRALLGAAAEHGLPVFFYGSHQEVLERLVRHVKAFEPSLEISGYQPSAFRLVDKDEAHNIAQLMRNSGAALAFVGLGCPRQERFVFEQSKGVDFPLIAVGAAFDYLAGTLRQPPLWIQRTALEWLWRLTLEPQRLWRRYLLANPAFLALLSLQRLRVWRPGTVLPAELGLPPSAFDA